MAQVQNLGVVSPTPKGEWTANTQYNYLNIVTLNGSSYIAKVANVNIEPNATTGWDMYWQLLAQGVENAETNAVLFTQQSLTNVQQTQARQNIGAAATNGNYPQMQVGTANVANRASMATQDTEGRQFTTTYATKVELQTVTDSLSGYAKTTALAVVSSVSVAANDWVDDNTYTDYPYRAAIAISGVTATGNYAEVTFAVEQATSGNYAPVCNTYNGGVYIYSQVNTSIVIPSILILEVVNDVG